jgi:hypothetical protein
MWNSFSVCFVGYVRYISLDMYISFATFLLDARDATKMQPLFCCVVYARTCVICENWRKTRIADYYQEQGAKIVEAKMEKKQNMSDEWSTRAGWHGDLVVVSPPRCVPVYSRWLFSVPKLAIHCEYRTTTSGYYSILRSFLPVVMLWEPWGVSQVDPQHLVFYL